MFFYSPAWRTRPLNSFNIGTTGYIPGAAGSTVTIPGHVGVFTGPIAATDTITVVRVRQPIDRTIRVFGRWSTSQLIAAANIFAAAFGETRAFVFDPPVVQTAAQAGVTRTVDTSPVPVYRYIPARTVQTGATNGVISITLKVGYFV